MRLIGNMEAKTDSKGRVFLPAVFRKELQDFDEEYMVMRKDVFQPCLVLYPQSVWNGLLDTLRRHLNRWNSRHQQIFRRFVADAEIINTDKSGRILIPKRYMTMAGINLAVRFIGMGDTVEIWSEENASRPFMQPDEFCREIEKIMGDDETAGAGAAASITAG